MRNRLRTPLDCVSLVSFVVLAACFARASAVDLEQCGLRLQAAQESAWNATNGTTPIPALHISRQQCDTDCGGGLGDISWVVFSQSFGAWFLPWIALTFQIPSGAGHPMEDVINFLVTIGSPGLAAYSLLITHLNAGWLSSEFSDLEYPNSREISAVISAFQHVPIRISLTPSLLPSLIILPHNDDYWTTLYHGAKKTRRWTIPLIIGFVWVVFAAILTVVDSFYYPPTDDVGYSVVAVWTWLVPLIMGWLYVGSQPEPGHLRDCLCQANKFVWVATDKKDQPIYANKITGHRPIEFMKKDDVDGARTDELRTIPVFNYARAFIWSLQAQYILSLVKTATAKVRSQTPVDHEPGQSVWVANHGQHVANENRLGSEEQVVEYCMVPPISPEEAFELRTSTIESSSKSDQTLEAAISPLPFSNPSHEIKTQSRWARGIWGRVVLSAILALGLQWGTVGAAIVIHYWKPPVGAGCQTLSFFVYGLVATLSMFLCLAASILAHISRPVYGHPRPRGYVDGVASLCGFLGKGFAFISGIGIMLICFFQSSGVYHNCFCTSTTFDKGSHDVVFVRIDNPIGPETIKVWIGGLVMAFAAAGVFGLCMFLTAPARRET